MSQSKTKKAEYADLRRAVYNRIRDEYPEIFLPIYVEEAQNRGIKASTLQGSLGVLINLRKKLKLTEEQNDVLRS